MYYWLPKLHLTAPLIFRKTENVKKFKFNCFSRDTHDRSDVRGGEPRGDRESRDARERETRERERREVPREREPRESRVDEFSSSATTAVIHDQGAVGKPLRKRISPPPTEKVRGFSL